MSTETTAIAPAALLAQLLDEPLPRGNLCGVCAYWRQVDGEEGDCAAGVPERARGYPGCSAQDGCYEWFSRRPRPAWYDADFEE